MSINICFIYLHGTSYPEPVTQPMVQRPFVKTVTNAMRRDQTKNLERYYLVTAPPCQKKNYEFLLRPFTCQNLQGGRMNDLDSTRNDGVWKPLFPVYSSITAFIFTCRVHQRTKLTAWVSFKAIELFKKKFTTRNTLMGRQLMLRPKQILWRWRLRA